ncbi:MAG: 30S ribosomal protein S16 [bacterium]|nr:30S ribosomal protein S16 [bacterium]
MLMVRLQRVGRKNDPSFRVVLTDSKNSTKSGKFLEVLGSYNARFGKPEIKADRVKYWVSVGAKVSPTVHNLLINEKITSGKKINVLPRKSPPKKDEAAAPEVAGETQATPVVIEEKQRDVEVKS